eukprot:gene23235-30117_t
MGLCCSKESRNNPLNAVLLDESYISSAQSPILRSSTTHEAQDENPILDVSTNSNADENTEGKGAPNVSTQQFAESRSSELQGLLTALEKCCNHWISNTPTASTSGSSKDLSPVDKLAYKCVSLQFLVDFHDQVVQLFCPTMTVKQVVDDIIIPLTIQQKCSLVDKLQPNMHMAPHAFICHAFGNPLSVLVESLK